MPAEHASAATPKEGGDRCYCDAAMMAVGLAGSALPFARSHAEEAERWLRVLRVSGAVGNAMQAIGVPEEALVSHAAPTIEPRRADSFDAVIDGADANRRARDATAIATEDLLAGVHATYGATFDHVLAIRGTTLAEVCERVECWRQAAAAP